MQRFVDNREFLPRIFTEGKSKFHKGLFQDAIRHFQYCIHRQYEIHQSQFYIGVYQFYSLDIKAAFVSFQSVLSIPGQSHSGAHYYLGVLCELLGNKKDAMMYYKEAIDYPTNSLYPLLSYKALSLQNEDESYKKKALQTFEIQLELSSGEKLLIEALKSRIKGDMEEAQESFILAKAENSSYFEPVLYMAEFYFEWGKQDEALEYWSILARKFHLPLVALPSRIKVLYDKRKYRQALDYWKQYHRLVGNPSGREYFHLGLIYSQMGKVSSAIEAYQKSYFLDSLFFSNTFNLAVSLQKKGDFNEAIQYYEQAFALEGDNPLPIYNMALVYFEQKNYIRAFFYLNKAYQMDPNLTEAKENAQYLSDLHMLYDREFSDNNRILLIWITTFLSVTIIVLAILHFFGVL